jgi:hypothetical protein
MHRAEGCFPACGSASGLYGPLLLGGIPGARASDRSVRRQRTREGVLPGRGPAPNALGASGMARAREKVRAVVTVAAELVPGVAGQAREVAREGTVEME